MPDLMTTQQPGPRLSGRRMLRTTLAVLLGWGSLGVALGLSVGVATAVDHYFGLGPLAVAFLQAALVAVLAVSAIVVLRRRFDRRPLEGLGVSRRALRPLALGVAVGALTGVAVWGAAAALGWIRIDSVDVGTFLVFLLLNGIILALYEAIPEEFALRGYVWTNARDGFGLVAATIVTTALFPFLGVVIGPVRWLTATALGAEPAAINVFPAGNDPVVYIVQLVLFGLALIAARRIPVRGALFIAIAFHWTQLTVTRMILGGTGWADSGWRITWVEPDAIALVLVHIVVAGLIFIVIRRSLSRPRGRRE